MKEYVYAIRKGPGKCPEERQGLRGMEEEEAIIETKQGAVREGRGQARKCYVKRARA